MNDSILKYILLGILAICLGFYIGLYVNSEKEIILNFNHELKKSSDSVDNNLIIYNLEESEKKLNEVINREFEKSVSYINTTAAFFGIFLTIFLIVFGFYTFNKIAESKKLLKEILNAPEKVIEKYDKKETAKHQPNLSSHNNALRSRAISIVTSSNFLQEDEHFEILETTLYKELDKIETSHLSYSNIIWLFQALLRLNRQRSIKIGIELFNIHFKKSEIDIFVELVMANYNKETDQKILYKLLTSQNKTKRVRFLNIQKNFSFLNEELMIQIINNSDIGTIDSLLNKALPLKNISLIQVFENIDKIDFTPSYITSFINYFDRNRELNSKSVGILSNMLLKSDAKPEDYKIFINHLIKFDKALNFISGAIKILKQNKDFDEEKLVKEIEKLQNKRTNDIIKKIK